jgi:hypothetical protein
MSYPIGSPWTCNYTKISRLSTFALSVIARRSCDFPILCAATSILHIVFTRGECSSQEVLSGEKPLEQRELTRAARSHWSSEQASLAVTLFWTRYTRVRTHGVSDDAEVTHGPVEV